VSGQPPGLLIAVVGPSGAGKDTLIALARDELRGVPGILFPRRVVTRPPSASEGNEAMSEAEFLDHRAAGGFALSWRAHGLLYGLRWSVREAIGSGCCAVVNLSRAVLPDARRAFPRVAVALVTAPRAEILARIAARGRESAEAIAARLSREDAVGAAVTADLCIVNLGDPVLRGQELAAFIRAQALSPAPPAAPPR
jgi:ribose 1,5-bisphosphokinase